MDDENVTAVATSTEEKETMSMLKCAHCETPKEAAVSGGDDGSTTNDAWICCGSCHSVWYCSEDHQIQDWKDHKTLCKSILSERRRKANRSANGGQPSLSKTTSAHTGLVSFERRKTSSIVAPALQQRLRQEEASTMITVDGTVACGNGRKRVNESSNQSSANAANVLPQPAELDKPLIVAANVEDEGNDCQVVLHNAPKRHKPDADAEPVCVHAERMFGVVQQLPLDATVSKTPSQGRLTLTSIVNRLVDGLKKPVPGMRQFDHQPNTPLNMADETLSKVTGHLPKDLADTFRVCRMSEHVGNALDKYGWAVVDNLIGSELAAAATHEVEELCAKHPFEEGRVAMETRGILPATLIRSDRVLWFDPKSSDALSALARVVSFLDQIVFLCSGAVNKESSIGGKSKVSVSCFPGAGSHYVLHVDNPAKDGREITVIYNLNQSWKPEYGGLLKLYPATSLQPITLEPILDRVIFLWSDRRCPYEVEPSFFNRLSLTVWYYNSMEKANAQIQRSEDKIQHRDTVVRQLNSDNMSSNSATEQSSESLNTIGQSGLISQGTPRTCERLPETIMNLSAARIHPHMDSPPLLMPMTNKTQDPNPRITHMKNTSTAAAPPVNVSSVIIRSRDFAVPRLPPPELIPSIEPRNIPLMRTPLSNRRSHVLKSSATRSITSSEHELLMARRLQQEREHRVTELLAAEQRRSAQTPPIVGKSPLHNDNASPVAYDNISPPHRNSLMASQQMNLDALVRHMQHQGSSSFSRPDLQHVLLAPERCDNVGGGMYAAPPPVKTVHSHSGDCNVLSTSHYGAARDSMRNQPLTSPPYNSGSSSNICDAASATSNNQFLLAYIAGLQQSVTSIQQQHQQRSINEEQQRIKNAAREILMADSLALRRQLLQSSGETSPLNTSDAVLTQESVVTCLFDAMNTGGQTSLQQQRPLCSTELMLETLHSQQQMLRNTFALPIPPPAFTLLPDEIRLQYELLRQQSVDRLKLPTFSNPI